MKKIYNTKKHFAILPTLSRGLLTMKTLGECRLAVEDLLSVKIKYHNQFKGREISNISRLLDILEDHPVLALEIFTEDCFTPLEFMISRRLGLDVIREFCALHPQALRKESCSNITEGLPLHVACDLVISLSYTSKLIPLLIDFFPQAVSRKDKDGNLPVHKLLRKYAVRLRPQIINEMVDCLVTEVQALLQRYPEAIMLPGQCNADMTPLEFILSVHSNILHPELLRGVLEKAPTSLRELCFEGSLGGPGVVNLEIAQAFERLMPQLVSVEWTLIRSAQYTSTGWSCFFRGLGKCRTLRNLDIHLPTRILADNEAQYAATSETIQKLQSLSTLKLTFADNRVDNAGCLRIAKLAEPIAVLIKHGNLQDLTVNSNQLGLWIDPIPILAASIDSKLRALELRPCPGDLDLTTLLVDLIQAEQCELQSLALKNVRLEKQAFFEALARNNTLQCLRLPHIISDIHDTKEPRLCLSQILKTHNTTLKSVHCVNAVLAQRKSMENQKIQYFTMLNRFGRARLRHMSCSRQTVTEELIKVLHSSDLHQKENGVLDVTFGLLREVPMLWSSK